MKLNKFLELVDGLDPDDYELKFENNIITDVTVHDNIIKLSYENALDSYYNHIGKMNNLKEMINTIKKDNIEVISEIEAVQIAHSLELSFNEVADEFKQNNINVEVL